MLECDLGFFRRSFSGIMGWFFDCFRVKDDRSHHHRKNHLIYDAASSKNNKDPLASRNRLASLLLSEDEEEEVHVKVEKDQSLQSPCRDSCNKELKDEAKYLKSCGTLPETPSEIRKTYGTKDSPTPDGDSETSKFHSWLPGTSMQKLRFEEQHHPDLVSAEKICDKLEMNAGGPDHVPNSHMPREQKPIGRNSPCSSENKTESPDSSLRVPVQHDDNDASFITPEDVTVTTQSKNKFVHFECESNMAYLPSSGQSSKLSDSTSSADGSKFSPYPTLLKLTDEMQTPGTVYATNPEKLSNMKNPRIRSQYVYPVLNPVQDFSQWKALKEDKSYTHQQLGQLRESCEESENTSPEHTSAYESNNSVRKAAAVNEAKVDASLSIWMKPSSSPKDNTSPTHSEIQSVRSLSSRTPNTERPILGIVAAHWNDEEPSRISPKWWDGNGIPNSTNKYKEDQKVSWHATPFEERLEKALSDETLVYQRKIPEGRPIDFDEMEDGDTAISQLQPSTHPESVVSF